MPDKKLSTDTANRFLDAMKKSERGADFDAHNDVSIARTIISFVPVFACLYLASLYSYLLFHTLVEIFSISVCICIFVICWNTRDLMQNGYLLFMGIAYFFVGILDGVHTMAYKGMGIFQGYDANLPTQLWIAARYLQSISLLVSPLFLRKKPNLTWLFAVYVSACLLLVGSILSGNMFPVCFVEGYGLTSFKIISEYIIGIILMASLILLALNKGQFDPVVFKLLACSIIVTILSELAFTSYVSVVGLSNLMGHCLKVLAFYFFYKALIEMGLRKPYSLIFRELSEEREKLKTEIDEKERFQESLKRNEQRLRLSLEAAKAGAWEWDLQSGENYWSNELWAVYGLEPHSCEPSYQAWLQSIHPQDRDRAAEAVQEASSKGLELLAEWRVLDKKEGERCLMSRGRPIRDEHGKVLRYVGIVMDITERRKIEEQIRTSEEMFKALVEGAPDALFVQTGGLFAYVNNQALKLFGAESPEQLLGKPVMDRFHPGFHETVRERIRLLNVEKKRPPTLEQIYLRMDGSGIDVEVSAVPIRFGNQDGALVFARDITDRKQAEQALRESEQRYRALVDNLPMGISVINPKMEIVAINPFFSVCYPDVRPNAGQICYSTCNDPPRSSPCSYCPCVLSFQDGEVHECETERPDGNRVRNYRIVSSPVKDDSGEVQFVVEMVEDVTERKSLQSQLAQAQKMEAVGTLAGGIAHDFNNLLQVIIGYSEFMLERKNQVDEDRNDLQKIYDAGRRGADLVKGLMAFSRQEEAKLVPVNLNEEVKKMERLLYHTIPKNIVIELHLEQSPKLIKADPSQIGQILMNLAINSKDAMAEGGKLVIETESIDWDDEYCGRHIRVSPRSYVLMTVSDTGEGMDSETQSHIFEPFFTTKSAGKGTGLGLATVYGIVKQHNGHIFCYSESGHGTTFKIYFPVIHGDENLVSTSDDMAVRGGTETILLVDDDDDIRDLGTRILQEQGYSVITAVNGKEGLEIYKKVGDRIELVVLDLIMPEMDGKLCLEEILKINPGAKVLLASGYSPNGSAATLISKGARGFVGKPFDRRGLLSAIREALDATEITLADL